MDATPLKVELLEYASKAKSESDARVPTNKTNNVVVSDCQNFWNTQTNSPSTNLIIISPERVSRASEPGSVKELKQRLFQLLTPTGDEKLDRCLGNLYVAVDAFQPDTLQVVDRLLKRHSEDLSGVRPILEGLMNYKTDNIS